MKNLIQSTFLLSALSFFVPFIDAYVGPVVPGQAIWCIDQRIASTLDIISSELDLGISSINNFEILFSSEIAVIINNAVETSSDLDATISLLEQLEGCISIPITTPTTITTQGIYCLNNNITGPIVVQANDVLVNLNNYVVTGNMSIAASQARVTIENGVVNNNGAQGNAILVNAGATDIMLANLYAKNAQVGIHCSQVSNTFIRHCSLTQNTTGIELDSSTEVTIDNCVAFANTHAGFDLVTSSSCVLLNSKADATGKGNNNVLNNTVVGFSASNGHSNIFERCIANGTQALSTTDFNSVVAGFALRGTEQDSKIIECEAANTTVAAAGVTVPYGILLQQTINSSLLTTAFVAPGIHMTSVSWSPDGAFFAGLQIFNNPNNALYVYSFDRVHASTQQLATFGAFGNTTDLDWGPNNNYIALTTSGIVSIIKFERINSTLTQVCVGIPSPVTPAAVAWRFDGLYLAVADSGGKKLLIYQFDPVGQILTQVATSGTLGTPVGVVWSPDGKFVAVADQSAGQVLIFAFQQSINTLTQVAVNTVSVSPVAIDWSPDGEFIAVGDNVNNIIYVYSFNSTTFAFNVIATTAGAFRTPFDPQSVEWSPDSQYIAEPDNPNGTFFQSTILIYKFDRGSNTLMFTLEVISNNPDGPKQAAWSPDGQNLLLADTQDPAKGIFIYEAWKYPPNNVIKNNTVYCNSGNKYPSGVGISGSSIANLIIQNTAYANPINPYMVDTSYIFVQNVFNQLFGDGPTLLQNIALGYQQPVTQPPDLALLLKQIFNQTSAVDSLTFPVSCSQIIINSGTVSGGTISITTSGSYCMSQDLTASMLISATCVTVDMNNRMLNGTITIQTAQDVELLNGRVLPPAPTTGGQASTAAITVAATAVRIQLSRLTVVCSDTTTNAINGRLAIEIAGNDVAVLNCFIKSGAGAANNAGAGGAGGMGIQLDSGANRSLIEQCVIRTGNGGNGTTQGGNGGNAILVNSGVSQTKIIGCTMFQVGTPGSPLISTGPQGGSGVVINSGALKTLVTGCILRNATPGAGTVDPGGLAVDNQSVTTNRSAIYGNVAYDIGGTVNYSNLSSVLDEFGVQLDLPPSNNPLNKVANVFFSPLA